MLDDITMTKNVEIFLDRLARRHRARRHPVDQRLDHFLGRRRDDRFDAIARRNHARTVDRSDLDERSDAFRQLRVRHIQPLAHVDRRGAMVDADED